MDDARGAAVGRAGALYVRLNGPAEGRAALARGRRVRAALVGRPGDGADSRRRRARRAAALPLVRSQRRAARPAPRREHGPPRRALHARRRRQSVEARSHLRLPRRGDDVPPAARPARLRRHTTAAGRLGRGALPVGPRTGMARADGRAHPAGLRHDRAVPAAVVPRRRSDRPARRRRPRGARRRGARRGRRRPHARRRRGRRAPDPHAGRDGRLPRRAGRHARGARGRLVPHGRSRDDRPRRLGAHHRAQARAHSESRALDLSAGGRGDAADSPRRGGGGRDRRAPRRAGRGSRRVRRAARQRARHHERSHRLLSRAARGV